MTYVHILQTSFHLALLNFKIRNSRSILGVLWYLLEPIVIVSVLLILHSGIGFQHISFYPVFLFIGYALFSFFRKVTIQTIPAIRDRNSLLSTTVIPTEILVFSEVINIFISHLFEVLILVGLLLYFSMPLVILVWYFFILFFLVIFCLGIALLFSTIGLYIEDLQNIWNAVLYILWFMTPIMYSVSEGPLLVLNSINPMTIYINLAREMMLLGQFPEVSKFLLMVFVSFFSLGVGYIIFNRYKKYFPEIS